MRQGFKQTEVGVIPRDWACASVNAIAASTRNAIVGGPFGSDLVSIDYACSGVPVIRGQNMGRLHLSGDFVFVAERKADALAANLARPGDIVFTQRGTLGQVSLVPDFPFERYLVSQSQMKLTVNHEIADPLFFCYVFASSGQQEYIHQSTIQTGVPHINLGILRGMPIQLPPLREQRAIAAVLGDVDALISALDRLVAKKRDLKQAAMQELLTGRKRLPGFNGEWDITPLGQLVSIKSGGTPSTAQPRFWDGGIMWCTPTDLTALKGFKYLSTTSRTISQEGLKSSSAELIPDNSIVMTSRATIGECAINRVPLTTNQGFKSFVPIDTVDVEFLYYLLLTQKSSFISLCGGSTFLEIGKAQLSSFGLRLPASKSEQSAIADILSDMDGDIVALKGKRDKTRLLKQGMMQELLTGRIRVV